MFGSRLDPDGHRRARPTSAGFRELAALGVETVLDVAGGEGDATAARGTNLKLLHVPMSAFGLRDGRVVKALRILADPANRPLVIHCQHGADRTDAIVALYRVVVQGWSKADALREMDEGGFHHSFLWRNLDDYVLKANVEALGRQLGMVAFTPAASSLVAASANPSLPQAAAASASSLRVPAPADPPAPASTSQQPVPGAVLWTGYRRLHLEPDSRRIGECVCRRNQTLISTFRGRGIDDPCLRRFPLTHREIEVVRLICAGRRIREIAARLFLSGATVKSHLHRISQKSLFAGGSSSQRRDAAKGWRKPALGQVGPRLLAAFDTRKYSPVSDVRERIRLSRSDQKVGFDGRRLSFWRAHRPLADVLRMDGEPGISPVERAAKPRAAGGALVMSRFSCHGRAERLIAAWRVALAALSLLASFLDPFDPAKHAQVVQKLLSAYFGYALAVFGFLWVLRKLPGWWALATQVFDLAAFLVFMYFTAGYSSHFFVYFTFWLVCATLRWHWRGAVWTGAVAIASFLVCV